MQVCVSQTCYRSQRVNLYSLRLRVHTADFWNLKHCLAQTCQERDVAMGQILLHSLILQPLGKSNPSKWDKPKFHLNVLVRNRFDVVCRKDRAHISGEFERDPKATNIT